MEYLFLSYSMQLKNSEADSMKYFIIVGLILLVQTSFAE